jgi:hypothetical protein
MVDHLKTKELYGDDGYTLTCRRFLRICMSLITAVILILILTGRPENAYAQTVQADEAEYYTI